MNNQKTTTNNKKRTKKTKETKVELVQLPIGAAIVTNDSFSSGRSYADECEWLPWPLEQANDMDGSQGKEDECGWLPWPVEKDK